MLLNTYCCNSRIFSTWNIIVVVNEALLKHWLSQSSVASKERGEDKNVTFKDVLWKVSLLMVGSWN